MNKKFTGEYMYLQDFDSKVRMRIGFTYLSLKPRLDTFPVVALVEDNGFSVVPGQQVFHKYDLFLLIFGADYQVFNNNSFSAYAGMNIMIGALDKQYELTYPTLTDESYSGSSKVGGVALRIGAEYMINEHLGAFIEGSRNFYLFENDGIFSANDIGIGVHYIFD